MPVVRLDTYKASMYLVWKLKQAGIEIIEDGGDIILTRLPSGQRVSLHLIESSIQIYEIKSTLASNGAAGIYTLFIFWADMLLPNEGHLIEPHDWEYALLTLYGDRIYAFDIFGPEVFIFPVHFDHEGRYRHIRYGDTLNMANMVCNLVQTVGATFINGTWRVATFADHRTHHKPHDAAATAAPGTIRYYYEILELEEDVGPDAVKVAYRRLARTFHPDVNQAPDATARMQAINEAYQRILEYLEKS
jgi:hypothetical protein